ncbi:MAG: glucan biosynthesis glucosyltransferase H, partial [Bradyrhizobium sp.]
MDAVSSRRSHQLRDETGTDFLPSEAPCEMVAAPLDQPVPGRPALSSGPGVAVRRALVLASTAALTAVGCAKMYQVVEVGGVTVLEGLVLVLFCILLAWITFAFITALAGFAVTLARSRETIPIDLDGPLPALSSRTAMLLPTYNEDPDAVMVRLRAMIESAANT